MASGVAVSVPRVLELDRVPERMPHRDATLRQLASALDPLRSDQPAYPICLSGPTGAGKTTIAQFIVRQLQAEALGIRWGYVNAISETSKSSLVFSLVRDAGVGNDLRAKGTATGIMFDRLRNLEDHFVAIIDEVDVIDDDTTIQALWEIPNVTLVLICVDENDFFSDLDSRVASRLRGTATVALEKYHHDELVDILWSRIHTGLASGVVEEETVEYIADVAAGDARHAITLLRRAVREAVKRGDEVLTVENVEEIREDAREEMHERDVNMLGTHQRHLYEIIKEAGEITAPELHARYEDRVSDPRVRSTRRGYLQSLEKYELIKAPGNTRSRRYRYNGP